MFLALFAGVAAVVAAILAALAIDANILRSPIARYAGSRLDRPVAIEGELRVDLLGGPRVEVNHLVVGNAQWGSRPAMLRVERAAIGIRLLPLLQGRIVLPEVELTEPDVLLERNPDGTGNWAFGRQPPASNGGGLALEIRALRIEAGTLRFRDAISKSDIVLQIDSNRTAPGASTIGLAGHGRVDGREFDLEGRAAPLPELQRDATPYRLSIKARAGDTNAAFDGTVVPLELQTIDGRLELSGADLSKLYPLVPVALPWTSAYRVSGHLRREGERYSIRDLSGQVGGSDVRGDVSLDLSRKRPFLSADLTSRRLDYKDLAGFLGAPPPAKGRPRPPDQQRAAEVQRATGRVLPSKRYELARLRAFDAEARLKADSVMSSDLPLDNVAAALKLKDGILVLSPLAFGLAAGNATAEVTLDARQDLIEAKVQASAANMEAKALLPALKRSPGSAGKVGGRATLSATGNSIADMVGSADGEIALIMSQGRASTLSLVLVNLDLANAAQYLLRGDPNAIVRCGVLTAPVRDGRAALDTFVIDSSEEKIRGEGGIDFKDEQYDLRLMADSKRASVIALRGPIRVGGTFAHPEVRPEFGPVVARVGAAVVLGMVATPLAALLPLVDPGNAKGADCSVLIEEARKAVPAARASRAAAPGRSAAANAGGN